MYTIIEQQFKRASLTGQFINIDTAKTTQMMSFLIKFS